MSVVNVDCVFSLLLRICLIKIKVTLIEIASNKLEEFYKIWTQKESYGKAIGKGLLYPTKNVFVDSIQNIVIDLNHHQPLGWNCETVHIRKEATVSFAYQITRKEDV